MRNGPLTERLYEAEWLNEPFVGVVDRTGKRVRENGFEFAHARSANDLSPQADIAICKRLRATLRESVLGLISVQDASSFESSGRVFLG
jgi:hypothetical protein